MKRKVCIIGIVAMAVAGILSGCIRPIDPSQSMGSVTISLASGGKTVQPPLASITVTSYTVEGSGPGGATVPLTPKASSAFTISDLLAGAWTFTINGLDASGNSIATGTVNVTIIPAETVSAEVQLAPLSAGGATGTFTLAATWAAPLSVTSIGGTITPTGGAAQPFTATIDGSAASYSNTTLPVGSYMLFVSATESGGGTFHAIYALKIYKNLESPLVLALSGDNFTPIVAAPVFSPGAGTYSSTQTVTITSATEGASIRYTIDGTTPSETEGTVYSSPLSVSSSKTITAIAYNIGMQTSSITSAAYVITGEAGMSVKDPWIPTITFSGQEASIVYGSSMTVTATVLPAPDSYAWYLDGQVIADATGSSVTLGSTALLGSHVVTLIVSKGTSLASKEFTFTTIPSSIPMVSIPGGSFQMGSPTGVGYDDERPVHAVTLSGFQMGKYEVTQTQYLSVTGSNLSRFSGTNLPVEYVTWYDAVEFCNKLSIGDGFQSVYTITGRTPTSGYPIISATVTQDMSRNGYRLPTEAEWEYAARGGNGTPNDYTYAGSNDVGTVAWYRDNAGSTTHTVGTKAANGLGLYDMSGNVWEWCQDWYDSGYYTTSPSSDPAGASSGTNRVLRGGSWYYNAGYCRSALRYYGDPDFKNIYLGFRVVRRP